MAIFKRGKKWVCVTFVARVAGKQRRIWRTFATRHEAETCEARHTLEGAALSPARLTVGDYLTQRLERHTVRPQSQARYRSAINYHLIPALGHIRLNKLGAGYIEDFIRRQAEAGYSAHTIRVHLAILGTAVKRAVKQRLLTPTQNPMPLIDLPAPGPRSARHWDAEQIRLFLGTVRRSPFAALFIVTVATGLRSCEVRALREEDYDPPFLRVRQKVRRIRGAWIFDDYLKTRAGERVVTLPPFAQSALSGQLTGQGGLLFKAQNGGPLHTAIVQGELDAIAEEAGIPRLRFHDLRHTQATVLAHAGVAPQIIQHRLGHSRIGVTMDLYAHKMPGQDAPAAEVLERLVRG